MRERQDATALYLGQFPTGTSQTFTERGSTSHGTGRPESIHRCPLVQPGELGRVFARIDDRRDPAYLGLALVMVAARA